MNAVFVKLPAFARHRDHYLDDAAFAELQRTLMADPTAGDVMKGAGGLRKLRFADARRKKGKRGGLRVIYYWWESGLQFWLFMVYDKGEVDDLTPSQAAALSAIVKSKLATRRRS